MLGSNKPKVLGMVSIKTAVRESESSRRLDTSTLPFESDLTVTTSNPAIAAEAGFVPWAESGMIATVR